MVIINLEEFYSEQAKINQIPEYINHAKKLAGEGNDIILTGKAPIWLYLVIAHALHGVVRSLYYRSPITGDVKIFEHNPY